MERSSDLVASSSAAAPLVPWLTISSTLVRRMETSANSAATKTALSNSNSGTATSPAAGQSQVSAASAIIVASMVRLPSAGRHVLGQPGEDFLVPELAVGRLEHPVALVREVDELARHALSL